MAQAHALTRRPRLALFALVVAAFVAADYADQQVHGSIVAAALLDETAHLLTALLIIWAVGGILDRVAIPVLIASVAIDLDHLPADFGQTWLTAGTPRPYSHSLLTIALVVAASCVPRARTWSLGIALGLVIHFWRDLAEPGTGVALFWPLSSASDNLPHVSYLIVMGLVVAIGLVRTVQDSLSVAVDGASATGRRRLIRFRPSQ